jgi:hypothetical protein
MKKGWKDITLRMAIEIDGLGEMDDEIDLTINQMAVIRDTTIDEIEKLNPIELINFVKEYDFMGTFPEPKQIKTFKKNKVRFGMTELTELKLAQMVDIEEYYGDGFLKNAHKILAVLYQPTKSYNFITKKYTLEDYKQDTNRENMFLDIDMNFVWSNLLFFWTIAAIYMKDLEGCSVERVKTLRQEMTDLMNED